MAPRNCRSVRQLLGVWMSAPIRPMVEDVPHFLINEQACCECLGDHAEAQCAAICPIEGAIVNELGELLNPPGSLTGIPLTLRELGLLDREAA